MKVVLFCGGMGMRLREFSESIPKPMVNIGYRPLLWYVMKYYAYYGHNDFILCLGYKADMIKNYFLNYDECLSNDFTLSGSGQNRKVHLLGSDIQDWSITFVDTGLTSNIGQRLKIVEPYLSSEEVFLANYTDGLTDLWLPHLIDYCLRKVKIAGFVCVKPTQSFHIVSMREDGAVNNILDANQSGTRINGGFFVFRQAIFNYIHDGEELVNEPFQRLIRAEQLIAYKHDGFWACMDTFKEKQMFDDMYSRGKTPWEVWRYPKEKAIGTDYA